MHCICCECVSFLTLETVTCHLQGFVRYQRFRRQLGRTSLSMLALSFVITNLAVSFGIAGWWQCMLCSMHTMQASFILFIVQFIEGCCIVNPLTSGLVDQTWLNLLNYQLVSDSRTKMNLRNLSCLINFKPSFSFWGFIFFFAGMLFFLFFGIGLGCSC